jgi:hypothetical protein
MFMAKEPVSVTLQRENLLWLRGRAASAKRRSLSDALDRVVTAARLGGRSGEVRSVVGTVDIGAADADAALHTYVDASLSRPFITRETGPAGSGGETPRTQTRRSTRRGTKPRG